MTRVVALFDRSIALICPPLPSSSLSPILYTTGKSVSIRNLCRRDMRIDSPRGFGIFIYGILQPPSFESHISFILESIDVLYPLPQLLSRFVTGVEPKGRGHVLKGRYTFGRQEKDGSTQNKDLRRVRLQPKDVAGFRVNKYYPNIARRIECNIKVTYLAVMAAASKFLLAMSNSALQILHCKGMSPPSLSIACKHLSKANLAMPHSFFDFAVSKLLRCPSSSRTFFCNCKAATFLSSIANTVRRVDNAGAVEPVESWHLAKRTSVLGDGFSACNLDAC